MNTKSHATKAVVQQTTNNTTSWIGHQVHGNKDIIGGQIFIAPSEVDLEAIEVLTSMVAMPGKVNLTLHSFDTQLNSWGPVMGSSSLQFEKADGGKWKIFNIPGLHLTKGKSYGFRLESADSYVGVGEAAGSSQTPLLNNGGEWQFSNTDQKGHCFTYFSLAFKIDARA